METTLLHHILAAALIIGIPVWDRFETRHLKSTSDPLAKVRSYQRIVAFLTISSLLVLLTLPAGVVLRPTGGSNFPEWLSGGMVRGIGAGMVAGLLVGMAAIVLFARVNASARQKTIQAMEQLRFFLPVKPLERAWFVAVSVAAGFGEEILYRSFLIGWFESLPIAMGLPVSIVLSAVVFGLAHGYQGVGGMIMTFLLALAFTALFYLSGSLWLPMIVHTLLDLRILLIPLPEEPAGAPAPGSAPGRS